MRNSLPLLFLILFIGCNPSSQTVEKKAVTKQPGQMKNAYDMVFEDTCIDASEKTTAEVIIFPSTGKDSILGKVFFSTGNLRKLADCNGMDYKISLNIVNAKNRSFYSKVGVSTDTVYFSVPYDSLKQVMEGKEMKYRLMGDLHASYLKGNEALGYGTSMLFNVNVKR